jgi:hypothetical protein
MTAEERLAQLDDITRRAYEILDQTHHVMHNGKPVLHPDTGEPVGDPEPVLHAIDILIRVSELRAAILGYDAASGTGKEITE